MHADLFILEEIRVGRRPKEMGDLVECHSGYEYGERPTALFWEGQRLEVEEILNRWRDPQGKGFRVRAAGRQMFELYYDLKIDAWRIRSLK